VRKVPLRLSFQEKEFEWFSVKCLFSYLAVLWCQQWTRDKANALKTEKGLNDTGHKHKREWRSLSTLRHRMLTYWCVKRAAVFLLWVLKILQV